MSLINGHASLEGDVGDDEDERADDEEYSGDGPDDSVGVHVFSVGLNGPGWLVSLILKPGRSRLLPAPPGAADRATYPKPACPGCSCSSPKAMSLYPPTRHALDGSRACPGRRSRNVERSETRTQNSVTNLCSCCGSPGDQTGRIRTRLGVPPRGEREREERAARHARGAPGETSVRAILVNSTEESEFKGQLCLDAPTRSAFLATGG